MSSAGNYRKVYDRLFREYGPQGWWPGGSRFEIMVGAVLTQNTSWTNVERAIAELKQNRCLHPGRILAVHEPRLATWLRPVGYFNVKARRLRNFCQWYLQAGEYRRLKQLDTDQLRRALLSVNGVGPETADDILLYAFDRPVFVIDAYTRRLFSRLGYVSGDESYEQLRHKFQRKLSRQANQITLFNEYHALIVRHAKDICRTQARCDVCCLTRHCDAARTILK